ncbi:serine hydrolase domain-containing protein [Microbispora sp. H10830]|uniref:serine hydrolase n=1 Tax=Microbispora sp. H10830 TaxID=2729109 RepID=UPI0015FFE3A9|nr:serine hydrolase domain-containing protein [Microbispora sp. H10830]
MNLTKGSGRRQGAEDRGARLPHRVSTLSPAKTFTAAAALRLVQEARLKLDDDINFYLTDLRIPDTFPGRLITLRHLLTRTAGSEPNPIGTSWSDPAESEPLQAVVKHDLPERVRAACTVPPVTAAADMAVPGRQQSRRPMLIRT